MRLVKSATLTQYKNTIQINNSKNAASGPNAAPIHPGWSDVPYGIAFDTTEMRYRAI